MSGIIGLLKNAGIASIKEGRYSFVKNETALQDFIDEHCFEKVEPSKNLFDENDAYTNGLIRAILQFMTPYYLGVNRGKIEKFISFQQEGINTQRIIDRLTHFSLVAFVEDKLFLRCDPEEICEGMSNLAGKLPQKSYEDNDDLKEDDADKEIEKMQEMDEDELWEYLTKDNSPVEYEGSPWGDDEEEIEEESEEEEELLELQDDETEDADPSNTDDDEENRLPSGWAMGFYVFTDDGDLPKKIPGLDAPDLFSPWVWIPKDLCPQGKEYIFAFECSIFLQKDFPDVVNKMETFLTEQRLHLTEAISDGAKTVFFLKNHTICQDIDKFVIYPTGLLKALSDLDTTVITHISTD